MISAALAENDKTMAKVKSDPNNRLATADILKVVSIFAVVFIHGSFLIPYSTSGLDLTKSEISLVTYGFRFCVPVFIFLWAYFFEKSITKKGVASISSRFYKLFIPFLFWSLVYFIFTANFKKLGLVNVVSQHFSGFGWSGQYYFIILFQLTLLFSIISKISRRLIKFAPAIYVASLLFYIVITYSGWLNIVIVEKLGHRPFIYWLPYVILGIIYAHRDNQKFSIPPLLGIISIGLIPMEVYFLHAPTVSPYLLPSVFVVSMLLINSIMATKLSYRSLNIKLTRIIQGISQNTLGIFCLNPLAIMGLNHILEPFHLNIQFPGCSIIVPLFSTLLVFGTCLIFIFLIKRIRLGFLIAN